MNRQMPTETIEFVRLIDLLEYMEEFNIDAQALLKEAKLSHKALVEYQQKNAVPSHVYAHLYHVALNTLPKEVKEKFWGGGFTSRSFKLAVYAMASAKTLRAALARTQQLHEIIEDKHPRISISTSKDTVKLVFHPAILSDTPELKQLTNPVIPGLCLWHSLLSWMIGKHIALSKVNIHISTHPEKSNDKIKRLLYIDDVSFGGTESYFEFAAAALDSAIVVSTDSLDHYLEYSPHKPMLLEPKSNSITKRVQAIIGDDFSRGLPSFEQLADRLELSPSSLRRQLLHEKTSYQSIKDQTRKQIAINLLTTTELPIGVIAEKIGLAGQGSFSRLFKQWQNTSPQQYRHKHSL